MHGYWFRSHRFIPIPGEDNDTAPGLYGRQLAHWLRDGLHAHGYRQASAQPHDWGWCVVAQQRPWLLWVGCGGMLAIGDHREQTLLWHCHVVVERRRRWPWPWLGRRQAGQALRTLDLTVRGLLLAAPDIQLVEPP